MIARWLRRRWFRKALAAARAQRLDSELLVLEFEQPDGMSDEAFLLHIRNTSIIADNIHRSLGGHGLKVQKRKRS